MTRLRLIREKYNLTQRQMARKLNIGIATYVRYENGTREPSVSVIKNFAKLFNTNTDYLLGLTDSNVPYMKIQNYTKPLAKKDEVAAILEKLARELRK